LGDREVEHRCGVHRVVGQFSRSDAVAGNLCGAEPTPPSAIPIVPLPAIVPPLRPAPAVTLVTVPPLLLSIPSAKPAGTPVKPLQGAALAAAARSASGEGRTGWRGARVV
jgi:hypothetical protein